MLAATPTTRDRDRWFVFGGVAVTLVGTLVFARGLSALDATGLAAAASAGELPSLLAGLLLLAIGIGLATTTRYGRPGVLAALGVPALALGLSLIVLSLEPAQALQTASVANTPDDANAQAGSSLLLTSGVVASLVGLTLLLVFGLRAKGAVR